ncbi:hypothetical protein ScPMuIL_008676 [Solemya velum]
MEFLVVGVVLVVIVVSVFIYLTHSGMFTSVSISTGRPPIGRVVLAYKFTTGSYTHCGNFFGEFAQLDGKRVSIGLYYDNPDEVPAEKLRWAVGQIVAENGEKLDGAVKKQYEEAGCKFITLPPIRAAITAKFHYKNNISMYFGMRSFYSKLMAYIAEKNLRKDLCMEIYDGNTVRFMVPLDQQESFVVPEAREKRN